MPAARPAFLGTCYYCRSAVILHDQRCYCPNCNRLEYVEKLEVNAERVLTPQVVVVYHKSCDPLGTPK